MNTGKIKMMETVFAVSIILSLSSCLNEKGEVAVPLPETGYPPEIANLITTKCAVAGCHNYISKAGAAGLSLETWSDLFEGSRGGATVIPYRPDFSTLMYYTNTDSSQGLTLLPTMPYNAPQLTAAEYDMLSNWVLNGAPDKNGFVKFSDNPSRDKVYVGNQGCDVVTVFDAQSGKAMRYVDVGVTPLIESPHMIRVSPDNQYWYVIFYNGEIIQKFSTATNALVGSINISYGLWNTFTISSDSKKAVIVDWQAAGRVAYVDLENMALIQMWGGFVFPHGSALSQNNDTAYITAQTGNFIYKIPVNDPGNLEEISLNDLPPTTSSLLNPHEILFSNDYSKYYITCQQSNEVRVMQTSNDSLLAAIPTGIFPVEMDLSDTYPYLFVSCMEDNNAGSQMKGKVYVINTTDNSIITSVFTGHQPHGIGVNDELSKVFVTNRNASVGGPAPHHASQCGGGNNGYVTIIDLNTLELVPDFKAEVSVDPYGLGITH